MDAKIVITRNAFAGYFRLYASALKGTACIFFALHKDFLHTRFATNAPNPHATIAVAIYRKNKPLIFTSQFL
jgi:hypothetical protein